MATTSKKILFGEEARSALMRGAEIMAKAVGTTLGPKGRNVSMRSQYGGDITVHDGVTVANEIKIKDPTEDIGASKLREAARKTNDVSGDGTTTATVLAYEIAKQGDSYLIAGANPMQIIKGINKAVMQATKLLTDSSEDIKGSIEKMIQVATVSAADEEIGREVASALQKVGAYGVVTVDKGSEPGYVTEYKDGMEWDKGWVHPGFVLRVIDGKPNIKLEAKIEDPYILITDHTITSPTEIIPFLNRFVEKGLKNLFIISDGLEREAMAILGQNFERGVLNVLPVSAPSLGNHLRDGLEDIAILTGGKFISKDMGMKIADTQVEDLGRADSVTANAESTVLIGGKGDLEQIKARAKQLEEMIRDAEHEQIKEKYKERLAKLTSGVAVIKVGTASDAENREKIERVRDAIGATKAAVEEGIISGGGLALMQVSRAIMTNLGDREESFGAEIVQKALLRPIKLLAENAGVNGEVVIAEILKRDASVGYNVVTGEYVDMKELGIVDPVRVTISALQNAASVAAMILTTEVTITDLEEEKRQDQQQ